MMITVIATLLLILNALFENLEASSCNEQIFGNDARLESENATLQVEVFNSELRFKLSNTNSIGNH